MSASQIEGGCRDSQGVLAGVWYYPGEAVGELVRVAGHV